MPEDVTEPDDEILEILLQYAREVLKEKEQQNK